MKKTIILFQPKFWPGPLFNEKPRTKTYYHEMRVNFNYLPLGILSVGTALKDKYDVRIIDQRFDRDWREQVAEILRDREVLFAGVSACTGYDISGGIRFSEVVREAGAGVPVVWGGWHSSTVPGQTIMSRHVDIAVTGQGEQTALELAERLESGLDSLEGIRGITYINSDGEIVHEPDREICPASELPEIDYTMVDVDRYLRYKDGTPARLFYMSTIGCPFRCSFCSIAAVYKRHWSSKPPERIVREIRYFVEKHGTDTVELDGTNFFANPKWAKEVLRALIDNGLRLNYVSATRADIILRWDDEMKDLIKKVGFRSLGVGGESGSQRMLDKIDKGIKVGDLLESLKVLKTLDIEPAYTFMFGLPGETLEESKMTLDVMARLKKEMPKVRTPGLFYHAFPGSETFLQYQREHNIPDMSLEEWARYSFDLTHTESLSITGKYVDFIRERLKYLEWAYPTESNRRGVLWNIFSWLARMRVNRGFYMLPFEWMLSKRLKKGSV
ncbi:MAG TPA: B12-binding domain-containing radical SAM protein [Actinobacteria bacterium]|nr:B12-binding domain-containing radical SAM protein [Actinomycetota bacterium]